MKRSESEILNDPEIWDVTGSDDEFQPTHTQSDQDSDGSRGEAGAGGFADGGDATQEMARYLVERAPTLAGTRS